MSSAAKNMDADPVAAAIKAAAALDAAANSPDVDVRSATAPAAPANHADPDTDLFDFPAYDGLNDESSQSDGITTLSPLGEMSVDTFFLALDQPDPARTPPPFLSPVAQSTYSRSSHGSLDPFETIASSSSYAFETILPSAMMAGLVAPMHALSHQAGLNGFPAQDTDQHDQDETLQGDEPPIVTAVRIDSDQLADSNAGTCRHEFRGESWRLTYVKTKDGTYSLSVRVPVVVTTDGDGPIDFDWKAVLIELKEPANRVDAAYVKSIVDGCNLDEMLDNGLAFSRTVTHTSARVLTLGMRFTVKIRKKYFLAIVVNDIGVAGLPNIINVHGDRNKRTRGGNKRKAPEPELDENDANESLCESPTVGKRAKRGSAAIGAASDTVQSASLSPTLPPMQQAQGPYTVTPPPSPDLAHNDSIRAALHTMIEATSFFDPRISQILEAHRFQASDAQVAASLVYNLHVASDRSNWTPAEIVGTLRALGEDADVIRQRAWLLASTYPHPMHAIARCTRPALVDALLEYLHPHSVPTNDAVCPQLMDGGHNQMLCDTCRALATSSALDFPDADGFWPIHAAAWNRNTKFVAHHLRIKGAHKTFAAANTSDGGNFFHTTCASLSPADWLESLWASVIVETSDRLVVAQALKNKNNRGNTPVDMAKFQIEHRAEIKGMAKRRTYEWVMRVIALGQLL